MRYQSIGSNSLRVCAPRTQPLACPKAIAASLGSLALGGVKNACEASGVGIMRAVPIAWSLVSAGLSGIAAANEVRCKNKDDKAKSAKSGLGLGK